MPAERAKYILLWLLKPFSSNDRQYWKVVLLCFIAAATFWLLNALNKNYSNIRTSYPLRFVYDQEKFIPLKPLPEEIEINVSGKGWKLLRKYLMIDLRPAEIVFYSIPPYKYLTSNALRRNVSSVLDGLQLNFISTDTVRFSFDRRIRRKIPLAVDSANIQLDADRIIASPIVITPDSVIFDGPASMVNKLPSPYKIKLPVNTIDRSIKRIVPLEFPTNNELVKANITEAEVSFAVSPLTWQQLLIPPLIKNLPEGKAVRIVPELITIRYGFEQTNAAPITPDQFEVAIDYTTYNPADSTAGVLVTRRPVQVKRISIGPTRVKLLQ
ncbi:hypothetical protein [Adhaeribacter aquaticus]|uniref:hypothetical protein n=1 Tax=Adhaeribacter aquaticus TaxID=299567 RepID=UPI0004045675|nr:hypothetical protein [Adhaeribacter aquaticus]